jgi:twitching motility protein PilT
MDIEELIYRARDLKASDLHMVVSSPPLIRIDGLLQKMPETDVVNALDVEQALLQITTEGQMSIFQEELELDFALSLPEIGYLRCNACLQQGSISLAIRLLPPTIPGIDELHLPQICKEMIMRPRGLFLVTGPTGSGKSTTLAAMIQHLNLVSNKYVVTIEDPVEYRYQSIKCAFSQREVAADTRSFVNALKYVLRQDPDVILVGEMRDLETVSTVLTAAETGHLILSTGHAPSAAQSVERIVDLFPPHERTSAQARLASALLGILCQALVPRVGGGRVAAVEIMLANTAVKNIIREGKPHLLPNTIRTHRQDGMCTLDESLVDLYHNGFIEWESVLAYCQDRSEVEKLSGEGRLGQKPYKIA